MTAPSTFSSYLHRSISHLSWSILTSHLVSWRLTSPLSVRIRALFYFLHLQVHSLHFQLCFPLEWIFQLRNTLKSTVLRLMTLERPSKLAEQTVTSICMRNFTQRKKKEYFAITLCVTSVKPTAARWPSRSATRATTTRVIWWRSTLPLPTTLKLQKSRLPCTTSTASSCWKTVSHAHVPWPPSTPMCRDDRIRWWHSIGRKTISYALLSLGWRQAHIASPGDKTEEYSKYIDGGRVVRGDIHEQYAEPAELATSAKMRLCRTLFWRALEGLLGKHALFKCLGCQL